MQEREKRCEFRLITKIAASSLSLSENVLWGLGTLGRIGDRELHRSDSQAAPRREISPSHDKKPEEFSQLRPLVSPLACCLETGVDKLLDRFSVSHWSGFLVHPERAYFSQVTPQQSATSRIF